MEETKYRQDIGEEENKIINAYMFSYLNQETIQEIPKPKVYPEIINKKVKIKLC